MKHNLWAVFTFVLTYWTYRMSAETCLANFFGSKCQYKCYCSACDSAMNCIGSYKSCYYRPTNFGLACQYQSLAVSFMANITPPEAQSLFNVLVNDECENIESLSSISITWNMSLPFSWMRFKVNNTDALYDLSLSFIDDTNSESGCINQRLFQVDTTTFDVHCDLKMSMTQMKIEGDVVKYFCYIRINEGRNMALFQSVSQSSERSDFNASYAVDGVVRDECHFTGCSHTGENDTTPSWTITFDQPYAINKLVLFNRYGGYHDWIKKFDLQVFNKEGKNIFNFRDTSDITQQVYTVLYPNGDPVSKVTVSQTNIYHPETVPYVTINEFQAYGECVDGTWGLECEHNCTSLCPDSCSKDDGTCNAVCIGYTNPPSCSIPCSSTNFGINCSKSCSDKCFNSMCDKQTGVCTQGCTGYSDPPLCTQPCGETYFGLNCTEICPTTCLNHSCDSNNGNCFRCQVGYHGDTCNQTCSSTYYGKNCSKSCSDKCFNSMCDKQTGVCTQGCIGYSDPPLCTQPCGETYFGLNCTDLCPTTCLNHTCNSNNGRCFDCQVGYHGDTCNQTCNPGSYDENCRKNCSINCVNTCSYIDGSCSPCKPGYQGGKCDQDCNSTKYGQDCTNTCSENCLENLCDKMTGKCLKCFVGKLGDFCEETPSVDKQMSSPSYIGIGIGISLGVIIVITGIICIVVCIRRRRLATRLNITYL